ncbi:LysR family transcriptional regulator [Saccharopolyspora shandongensis]|uniref:LysR family transcriptional regulator n=1 Tax=Saccharopolyspora shandongensis TaxID=418495 RepID=UPI003424001F
MSLEWGRLRILDAVARSGSVTRAAAMLHMTGPAVSQQLRRIEAEAGAKVVVADGRGVRLTPRGRVLADYANRVAELMQQAENDLHRDEPLAGHLRIAAIASTIRTLLAAKLPAFRRAHPRVRVSIEDGETIDHLAMLSDGRLELVLAESWNTAPLEIPRGIRARQIESETVCLALPVGHPLADRGQIDIRDLAGEQWATCAHGSDSHTALVQMARDHDVEPDVTHHVADHSTQLALVRAGLAIACLPASAEIREVPGVICRPLAAEMRRDVLLLASNRTAPLAVEALVEHLR